MKGHVKENHRESIRVPQIQTMRVRFGSFVFDSGTRELLKGSRPLHLSPKAFDLLQVLLERRPLLVSKAELQDRVWPDAFVDEANVGNAVAEIRRVLGDDPKSPDYICTVSRRGYRFCGDVVDLGAVAAPGAGGTRWWLAWRDATLPLAEGENTVGRNPANRVWIDGTSVSREHARIVIAGGRATIEDRGSRNGTFVDGKRISARHPLQDGSVVAFGSEQAIFRQWSDEAAMDTEPVRSR
jgi:DNA-binding winged helix-turn-helix (wHTH) protein